MVLDCTPAASLYFPLGVGWQLGAAGGLTGGVLATAATVGVGEGVVEVGEGVVEVEDGVVEVDDGVVDVDDGVVDVEDRVVDVEDEVVEVDDGRMDVEKVDETELVADEAVGDEVLDTAAAVAVNDSDTDIGVAAAGPLLLGMLMT